MYLPQELRLRDKILRVYVVDAPRRIDARNAFARAMANDKEDEYLESVTIEEIEPEVKKTA